MYKKQDSNIEARLFVAILNIVKQTCLILFHYSYNVIKLFYNSYSCIIHIYKIHYNKNNRYELWLILNK